MGDIDNDIEDNDAELPLEEIPTDDPNLNDRTETVKASPARAVATDAEVVTVTIPRSRTEIMTAIANGPDFMNTIVGHISNGGTLITLAELWDVTVSDITKRISRNPEWKEDYKLALKARDEWEKERLLQELRAIATVDIREAYDENGRLKDIKDMPASVAAAISNIESAEEMSESGEVSATIRKVKFWDKAKAIETFLKKHGMLVDRSHVTVGKSLEDLVHEANVVIEAEVVPNIEESKAEDGVKLNKYGNPIKETTEQQANESNETKVQ